MAQEEKRKEIKNIYIESEKLDETDIRTKQDKNELVNNNMESVEVVLSIISEKEKHRKRTIDEFLNHIDKKAEEKDEEFTPKQLEKIRKMIVKEIANQCCRHTSLVCSSCR